MLRTVPRRLTTERWKGFLMGLSWLVGPMEDLTTLISFLEAPTATSSFPTVLEDLWMCDIQWLCYAGCTMMANTDRFSATVQPGLLNSGWSNPVNLQSISENEIIRIPTVWSIATSLVDGSLLAHLTTVLLAKPNCGSMELWFRR